MPKKKPNKGHNMMYAQKMAHLPAKTMDNFIDLIENKVKPEKYAVILHDKCKNEQGQPVAPHIHVMLSFPNARHVTSIAKLLNDKPQYVEKWKGNAANGYAYLVHATDKARSKHQYDPSEVRANYDYVAELQAITKEVETVQKYSVNGLLDSLYSGAISKKEVESRLKGSQYGRHRRQIEDIYSKRLQNLAEAWRNEMIKQGKSVQVIWVYGLSGTGKTSLAKVYAKKSGQDFFVSGSSRDVFQNYEGQHKIIIDELRPEAIPYQDFLRILDPFSPDAQTMLPARYKDKGLAADLIIITTPFNPYAFYKMQIPKTKRDIDRFDQLLRRISLTIKMTDTEICAVKYDETAKDYVPEQSTIKQNTYSSINYPAPTANAVDLFNSMLT
ncbi:MAG: Rep family protein [Defluviitaleaceae bacterium]|nr:Rep family protein [Defluviitaleaceae bacterium]